MDKPAWLLICTVIFLSPVTLLEVSPSTILLFDMLCLVACMFALKPKRKVVGERFISSITLPFLLVSIYLAFQILPLSPTLLKLLQPETWQIYQDTIWKLSPDIRMPISGHAEATIYAWLHICALWAFCLAFGLLIDSHGQLFRLIQVFVLAVIFWSILIITANVLEETAWGVYRINEIFNHKYRVALGFWTVSFLPVLFAGYATCRSNGTRHAPSLGFRSFLKKPVFHLPITVVSSLFLFGIGMLLLFEPILLYTVFTVYLLFLAFKPSREDGQYYINKKIFFVASGVFVIGLVVWITCFQKVLFGSEGFAFTNTTEWGFSWFGYGLGAHTEFNNTKSIAEWGKQTIVQSGGLAGVLAAMGGIGSSLILVSVTLLYLRAGGRESINISDKITSGFYFGGLAGLVLFLITSCCFSLWPWQSIATGMIILTLFVTWTRRVSHLMVKGVTHEISKVSVWGLRIVVCVLFTATLTMTALNAGAEILRSLAFDSSNDFYSESNEEWLKVLSALLPYNSDLPLSLGNQFLVEKRDREAKAQILSAVRARPLSPQVHVAVASVSACTGDEDTAVSFFTTNVAKNYVPDNTTGLMTARLLGLPESKAAIKLINLTLEHSPHLASFYINLMTLYGYKPLTLKPLLPEQPLVTLALGDLLLSEGHTDEAEKVYMEAVLNNNVNLARDETLYVRIATYFSQTKRLTRALFIAKAGRERYPNSKKMKYLLLDIRAQLGLEK